MPQCGVTRSRGVTRVINDPAEEQAVHQLKPRTLDAWSWIARAREAAAKSVAPAPQAADDSAAHPAAAPVDPDSPAD